MLMSPLTPHEIVSRLERYEFGTLPPEDFMELMQTIIDNGYVWTLDGEIQALARALIGSGQCRAAN
jgi:hypothetical protein